MIEVEYTKNLGNFKYFFDESILFLIFIFRRGYE